MSKSWIWSLPKILTPLVHWCFSLFFASWVESKVLCSWSAKCSYMAFSFEHGMFLPTLPWPNRSRENVLGDIVRFDRVSVFCERAGEYWARECRTPSPSSKCGYSLLCQTSCKSCIFPHALDLILSLFIFASLPKRNSVPVAWGWIFRVANGWLRFR